MLFRRTKPATLAQKIREFLWPRKGFSRGLRYMTMRVLRLSSSPHSIAVGVAAGAASSATPFIGFHILIALAVAYLLSGNLIAAGIATALANPLTIPFILAATYELGMVITGQPADAMVGHEILHMLKNLEFSHLWGPVLKPVLIGSVPAAGIAAIVFYAVSLFAARLFQSRRRIRLGASAVRSALATDGASGLKDLAP
ncbi:DUF2062 domain-containing protein [Pararhizobium antarcticum]|uniref:DUF2062 domain-containing protein n=1 Tax=Pararhizobium antarcticum TaxID=1798805 RepID=UPI0008FFA6FB|nr:DUF2062 domain-containing protein [Pararhizobium antarcticum]